MSSWMWGRGVTDVGPWGSDAVVPYFLLHVTVTACPSTSQIMEERTAIIEMKLIPNPGRVTNQVQVFVHCIRRASIELSVGGRGSSRMSIGGGTPTLTCPGRTTMPIHDTKTWIYLPSSSSSLLLLLLLLLPLCRLGPTSPRRRPHSSAMNRPSIPVMRG